MSPLECLGNIAAYSGAELAQKAGVSKATAGRFFRRLGYEISMRCAPRRDARADRRWRNGRRASARRHRRCARRASGHGPAEPGADVRAAGQPDVERALSLLAGGRRICIAGFRNGRVLAQYAWALLTQLRDGVVLVPGAGLNLAEDLADLGPDDVLLVMDFRRRVTLLKPIVEHANRVDAKVVVLTDPTATELPARSDLVLRCVNNGSAVFDSTSPPSA